MIYQSDAGHFPIVTSLSTHHWCRWLWKEQFDTWLFRCTTSRGNVASNIGIFNHIRQFFAQESGEDISLFSFNAAGACPKCEGRGYLSFEMNFLDAVKTRCPDCEGTRYKKQALSYTYRGKNIAEVLSFDYSEIH